MAIKRLRQSNNIPSAITRNQNIQAVNIAKSGITGMNNIPVDYFVPGTVGKGLLGTGLIKPLPINEQTYALETNSLGNPTYSPQNVQTWSYFFVEYPNRNTNLIQASIRSFVVIKTLSPLSILDVSKMLGMKPKSLKGLTKSEYELSTFTHPTYTNDSGTPLSIRYAEIPIQIQRTPGRLDNVPIGSPSFDSTPDAVTTSLGPIPAAPYTDFSTSAGSTSSVTIVPGGTVYFIDTSPMTPWQFAPTGWIWDFGATGSSASPTGSTNQNVLVTYGATGVYTVSLTASNSSGSKTKTKTGFVIVTY